MAFRSLCAVAALALLMTVPALAEKKLGYEIRSKQAAFADVRDDVKDAIIDRGFVIDYTGHIGDMLSRTSEAAGSVTAGGVKSPYLNAEYMQFCPSKITHESVSANPANIANCPIVIFIYEAVSEPGKINVGFRLPIEAPSKKTREANDKYVDLLRGIVKEATE